MSFKWLSGFWLACGCLLRKISFSYRFGKIFIRKFNHYTSQQFVVNFWGESCHKRNWLFFKKAFTTQSVLIYGCTKKMRKKRSEIVKKSLSRFFFLIKRSFMFRQHFVVKYKLTYLGICKPTFKVLWLTKTGALLHFYLKILFWFFSSPPPPPRLLGWEQFLKSYMFSQSKKIIFHSALESVH